MRERCCSASKLLTAACKHDAGQNEAAAAAALISEGRKKSWRVAKGITRYNHQPFAAIIGVVRVYPVFVCVSVHILSVRTVCVYVCVWKRKSKVPALFSSMLLSSVAWGTGRRMWASLNATSRAGHTRACMRANTHAGTYTKPLVAMETGPSKGAKSFEGCKKCTQRFWLTEKWLY